ncbi:hypothetical protein J1N35_022353 [Gossypium stocksii]|uniref:Uncharacterized protein n=1 Tax=Gossypium stocksii TaxID=47602 RepID=A0A9D3VHG0_9ROSI|nr:hypothetical protein J1N35_022353 [Gossypium stocksii]
MKIVKTRLRNKMKDDFLSTYLVTYNEKEIAREFSTDSIIDEFDLMKKRRVPIAGCAELVVKVDGDGLSVGNGGSNIVEDEVTGIVKL